MRIFSSHRKKLEPKRRFGSREFKDKIKSAQNYKRVFNIGFLGLRSKFWRYIGLILFIFIFYYLCISSRFVVTQASVTGNVQVSTQQIQDAISQASNSRIFLIKKTNFIFMTQGWVNQIITQALPTIKEITNYSRTWPNQIKFNVVERVPGFVIQSNNQYFLVDEDGVVISQVTDPQKMLLVVDRVAENFALGEALPNAKLAAFVVSLKKQWPSKISTPIASVKFPGKASSEVQFVSSEGWSVMFDTGRSAVAQLNSLAVLLNKTIAPKDRSRLAYIDLRLSKWAYYCFNATPCSQMAQPPDSETPSTNAKP